MSNNEFHQRRLSATPRGVGVMCNFFAQSAENATLKDCRGQRIYRFRRRHCGAEYRASPP
ncbi:hypothetical protein LQQ61_06070 (plasmid) [Escherichia coli]|nr:hypothetical protein LQQ61_06070 [Escherichia coli]